jgi:hypothetical protein
MMSALALWYGGGLAPLWAQLIAAKQVLFWLMLGGFVWVIGDLFQQYAAKYVGISRGIPLSNTNQLWGLLWGILVFGELRGHGGSLYAQVIGGSVLMAAGAAAIAFSSAKSEEQARWHEAAHREGARYGVAKHYVRAGLEGKNHSEGDAPARNWLDWVLVVITTGAFVALASLARRPELAINWGAVAALSVVLLIFLGVCGMLLWRTTRFN